MSLPSVFRSFAVVLAAVSLSFGRSLSGLTMSNTAKDLVAGTAGGVAQVMSNERGL